MESKRGTTTIHEQSIIIVSSFATYSIICKLVRHLDKCIRTKIHRIQSKACTDFGVIELHVCIGYKLQHELPWNKYCAIDCQNQS